MITLILILCLIFAPPTVKLVAVGVWAFIVGAIAAMEVLDD